MSRDFSVKAEMVDADGNLPAYAWPGGYPIAYYSDDCHTTFCAKCATVERSKGYQINPLDWDVYWEGPPMECDECGAIIESAYGDPDEGQS